MSPVIPAKLLADLIHHRHEAEKAREVYNERTLFWTASELDAKRVKYNEARALYMKTRRSCVYIMSMQMGLSDEDVAYVMGDGMTPEIVRRFKTMIKEQKELAGRTRSLGYRVPRGIRRRYQDPPLGIPVDNSPPPKRASRSSVKERVKEVQDRLKVLGIPDDHDPGSG